MDLGNQDHLPLRAIGLFLILGAFIYLAGGSSLFAAEDIPYDPYAPIWREAAAYQVQAAEDAARKRFYLRLLEQPFRPLGHGLGKTAEWVERYHVDDKVVWFFDELELNGIYPGLRVPTEGGLFLGGLGGRVKVDRLLDFEQPFLGLEASGGWTPNYQFAGSTVDLGARYTLEAPMATSFFHEGMFSYRRSSSENFFGIGQETSLGDWSTYQPEETRLGATIGYHVTETVETSASFVFQHMKIGNGNRERVGKIKEHFRAASVPGLEGGNLVGFDLVADHDSRDHEQDPRRGGYEALGFAYYHDTDGSDFHYLRFSGSVSHFFPILSDRRILALRLAFEKNQELGGDEIPFFNLSRLGGAKRKVGSELLRSFRPYRFHGEGLLVLSAEYRYRIYEYRDFAGDAVAFTDVGEVFEELGDFGFEDLKLSFGGGVDLKFRRKPLFSLAVARGNEGWRATVARVTSF